MSEQAVHDWIRKAVASNDVVLFMKGTKSFPQCGFSAQVGQILGHMGVDYKDVNVLEDMGIREGIKSFSQWPTIPQLYVKGEFVGGCDIIREMFQQGELQQLLDDVFHSLLYVVPDKFQVLLRGRIGGCGVLVLPYVFEVDHGNGDGGPNLAQSESFAQRSSLLGSNEVFRLRR